MAIILDDKTWMESAKNRLYGIDIQKIAHEDDITLEMLTEGLKTSAELVKLYGRRYLPIFERMDYEIQEWKKNEDMLERALEVASINSADCDPLCDPLRDPS